MTNSKPGDLGSSALIWDKINIEKIHRLNFIKIWTDNICHQSYLKKS